MKRFLSIVLFLISLTAFAQDPWITPQGSKNEVTRFEGGAINDSLLRVPVRAHDSIYPDVPYKGRVQMSKEGDLEFHDSLQWNKLATTAFVQNAMSGILNGSDWVIYGDSFSADPVNDYPAVVAEKLKLNRTIYAVSGATIATQLTVAEGQVTGNADFFDDFDIATIHIGINDFASSTILGNVNSTVGGGTFAGKLRRFIELIQTSNPLIKIWVMTPPEAQNAFVTYKGTNIAGYTLEQMANVISQVCNYYSIQCVDLYNVSGINLKTLAQLTSDGLHPSVPLGINRLGNIVADAMLSNCSQGKNNKNLIGTANTIPRFDNYGGLQGNLNLYHLSGKTGNFHTPTAYGHWCNGDVGLITAGTFGNKVALLAAGTSGLYGLAFGSLSDGSSWSQVVITVTLVSDSTSVVLLVNCVTAAESVKNSTSPLSPGSTPSKVNTDTSVAGEGARIPATAAVKVAKSAKASPFSSTKFVHGSKLGSVRCSPLIKSKRMPGVAEAFTTPVAGSIGISLYFVLTSPL